jgi:histidyl-tRNA synthetase
MSALIEPKVLKGFRDFLPERESQRLAIIGRLEESLRLFGFPPIDTPVLEYAEILLGKGGGETDKQVYRFTDHGGRDVALRYDLTVPFARFMAAHLSELPLPFKRYHAAKVWRGENTQRGRYREFMQVDFDIVGADSASADLETLLLIRECMQRLGLERFTIRYAHRGVFSEFLSGLGLSDKSVDVLRIIDKERKIGREKAGMMLSEIVGDALTAKIMDFITVGASTMDTLEKIKAAAGDSADGMARLTELSRCLSDLGYRDRFVLDPSITRGLDYYTGLVCETFLSDLPEIGSICSGGRYNELASLYTRQSLPGVGASIGLDRLMAAMEELKILPPAAAGPSVLVFFLEDALLSSYHRYAAELRAAGIPAEVFPENKKLPAQFAYAEKRGIRFALIHGQEEAAKGTVGLKDLRTRESWQDLSPAEAVEKTKELLR